jgi:hypothetical protein
MGYLRHGFAKPPNGLRPEWSESGPNFYDFVRAVSVTRMTILREN